MQEELLINSENDEKKQDENDNDERILYIWGVPAKGHSNPALCLTNELLLKLNEMNIKKVIFYSCSSYRDSILNLPNNNAEFRIEFRDYELKKYTGSENFLKLIMNFDTRPGCLFRFFQCWENALKLGVNHLFKKLLNDIHREKPLMIIYDQALFFPKLLLTLYSRLYREDRQPIRCCYVTSFLFAKGVYPLWSDMFKTGMMGTRKNLIKNIFLTAKDFFTYTFRYYKTLWWDYNFSLYDLVFYCDIPFERNVIIEQDSLNLVFVLPELQPRCYLFEAENIKFVGPAFDEQVRLQQINNAYTQLVQEFMLNNENKPIIYVSMGTVFNYENSFVFDYIIEACKSFSNEYSIIVSTGDEETHAKYAESNIQNFIFVPHTPQIEILKKAVLFITHAGMNSVSEALHYAVPIICIPLFADQHFVAWRVADELNIGVKLTIDTKFTCDKIKEAIKQVLNDTGYRARVTELSLISKNYSGLKTACEYLTKHLKNNSN